MANGKPSVLVIINRQPNANIIETVDRVTALLPALRASIPSAITLTRAMERTATIRASLRDVGRALTISIALVILVVFVFLRDGRATLIPSVAVPVSLVGTFGVMYLCGFSINNFTLMALTIATGFVVDDAIVVLENTSRHVEKGMAPFAAALQGAREVGFTVLSMSLSLIAVFIPILLMGGIVGRLFREFAVTLSVAILISLVVSLTTTPMMCARLLRPAAQRRTGRLGAWSERVFDGMLDVYRTQPRLGAARTASSCCWCCSRRLPQRLPLRDHSQGILSAAGHRAPGRRDPGRPEHLVPGDAAEARRFHDHRQRRSGGRERRRLHRRRAAQFRHDVRRAEADRRAPRDGGPGDRAAARQAREGARRQPLPAAGAGHPDRRPAEQRAIPVHAAGRRPRRAARVGAEDPAGAERSCPSSPTSTPTSRTRACRRRS